MAGEVPSRGPGARAFRRVAVVTRCQDRPGRLWINILMRRQRKSGCQGAMCMDLMDLNGSDGSLVPNCFTITFTAVSMPGQEKRPMESLPAAWTIVASECSHFLSSELLLVEVGRCQGVDFEALQEGVVRWKGQFHSQDEVSLNLGGK